jgi:uncharacterized membrane protein
VTGSGDMREGRNEQGSSSRILAASAYFLVALSGLFLLVWKRDDRFVRFHSLQAVVATVVFMFLGTLLWLLGNFPIFGFLYAYLLKLYTLTLFLYWLFLMFRAWQGDMYMIPFIGNLVKRQLD